jgi:4-hydroxy-3-polyprenylbenzoate decarboxylase
VTDVAQVMWAMTSRAHPAKSEIYFHHEAQNALPVFLTASEKSAFQTTKVVHNALLADRFAPGERPVRSDLTGGWPPAVVRRVLDRWTELGFAPNARVASPRRDR